MRFRARVRILAGTIACAAVLAGPRSTPAGAAAGRAVDHDRGRSVDQRSEGSAARGQWSVARTGSHTYRLTWVPPSRLHVQDSRPEIVGPGALPGATGVTADGREVATIVRARSAPQPAAYDVTAGGRLLDESTPARLPVPKAAPSRPPTTPLDDDPGVPGPLPVVSTDYRLPATKLPGLPAKVEMLGHVVRPARRDPSAPLVVFLHGRHQACFQTGRIPPGPQPLWPCGRGMSPVPSYLGFDYVQRLLASQGYLTVSISANGINAQDGSVPDGGAGDRALLLRRHLELWTGWADSGAYAVDMSSVILVGHSRGGEGVDRASITTPLSAPYTISGQVLIGPTDFGHQAAPYVPTVTVLPYCDGDVSDLQGQQYTDIARDAAPDDTALHSSVLVMGADHNFFNSQWTPGISTAPSFDDWSGPPRHTCGAKTASRLSAAQQRKVGRTYIAGAVHLFTGADAGVLPMFDGSAVRVGSAGDADVRSEAVGGGRVLRRPGLGARPAPTPSVAVRICRGTAGGPGTRSCGQGADSVRTPHWVGSYPPGVPTRPAFEMSWMRAGQSGGMVFARPLDLSAAGSLDLRTVVDPRVGDVNLAVRIYDAQGDTLVTPVDAGDLAALPQGDYSLGKEWAQTLRVPLAGIPGGRRDAVTRVDLVATSARGHVWVLDLAAAPAALPAVPHTRLAVVDLHKVEQMEGNAPAARTVRVPYTVSGGLPSAGRLTVVVTDQSTGEASPPTTLVVAPHTTSGTIDVPYRPNRLDDLPVRALRVTAYATRRVMTGSYLGAGRIVDDDKPPHVAVSAARPVVPEGAPARWRLSLSKPVNYYLDVVAHPVRGGRSRPTLTVADLPKKLRRAFLLPVPALDTPLWKTEFRMFLTVAPGRSSVRLTLPTRARPGLQGRRTITMHFRTLGRALPGLHRSATVRVRDRR